MELKERGGGKSGTGRDVSALSESGGASEGLGLLLAMTGHLRQRVKFLHGIIGQGGGRAVSLRKQSASSCFRGVMPSMLQPPARQGERCVELGNPVPSHQSPVAQPCQPPQPPQPLQPPSANMGAWNAPTPSSTSPCYNTHLPDEGKNTLNLAVKSPGVGSPLLLFNPLGCCCQLDRPTLYRMPSWSRTIKS